MKKYIIGAGVVVLAIILAFSFWPSKSDQKDPAAVPKQGSYVALGDSVAAGVGLKDYSDSSACDRTRQAYPERLAAKLNYSLKSVACGGATTASGLLGPQDVNKLAVVPQIDAVLSSSKPNLISITIGANDADWTTAIQKCYTAVCGSAAETVMVNAGLAKAAVNLEQVMVTIKTKYPTATPDVVLTGYYRLFPALAVRDCTELGGIEPAELLWIRQLQDSVDKSLQAVAAKYDFATFVAVNFTGHELCSSDPWIQGFSAKNPYHPTEAGQNAIADQILSALATGPKRKTP